MTEKSVQSAADIPTDVQTYLDNVTGSRREPFLRLFDELHRNVDPGFELTISYTMPGWVVPHSTYPGGYHCDPTLPVPYLSIANQKSYISVYHMGLYQSTDDYDWFVHEYEKTGYKLNMGASCIRFSNMSKIPFELMGELARRIPLSTYIDSYAGLDPRNK